MDLSETLDAMLDELLDTLDATPSPPDRFQHLQRFKCRLLHLYQAMAVDIGDMPTEFPRVQWPIEKTI